MAGKYWILENRRGIKVGKEKFIIYQNSSAHISCYKQKITP